jgi:hypothetical protein
MVPGYVYQEWNGTIIQLGGLSDVDTNGNGNTIVEVETDDGYRYWIDRNEVILVPNN